MSGVIDHRRPPFVHIERYIFEDYGREAGAAGLGVYLSLVSLSDYRGLVRDDVATIGHQVGLEPAETETILDRLAHIGLIRRRERQHRVEWHVLSEVPERQGA